METLGSTSRQTHRIPWCFDSLKKCDPEPQNFKERNPTCFFCPRLRLWKIFLYVKVTHYNQAYSLYARQYRRQVQLLTYPTLINFQSGHFHFFQMVSFYYTFSMYCFIVYPNPTYSAIYGTPLRSSTWTFVPVPSMCLSVNDSLKNSRKQ